MPPPPTSLTSLFRPRSIAVVGASTRRDSIGFALLHNLILGEFAGAIYPVNPHAPVVHSLRAYRRVGDIPDPVDLAVVMVPKHAVPEVVDECLEAGIRGLVVITAGFAETGPRGAAVEAEVRDAVRRAGARMIGPNCMGVINTEESVRMNATFAPVPAEPGSIGFVSQSGALGVAILNVARDLGVGLTQFASMGNKADVSGNDLLELWEEDEATRVICMYLESFGNPRRFTEIAKRVGRRKPILVVKSGRTAEGARAASSHTGAIAGADVTVSAFLEQCGVIRAATIDELFDTARALDRCPLPAGDRVAVVTNAGGPGIMATDACVNLDLAMAELGEATRRRLAEYLPPEASLENPVDMIASATAEDYERTLAAVLADDGVDMVMAINVTPLLTNPMDVMESIAGVAAGAAKPVLTVMMATEAFYDGVRGRRDLPPVYRFPEPAARVLARMHRYAAWRRTPEDEPVPRFEVDEAAVDELLAATGEGYLPDADALAVLEAYGIPTVPWRRVDDAAGAAGAAAELGYPVVAKGLVPGLVHKSDAGAVAVDLRDEEELAGAVAAMEERLAADGRRADGFLVQRMAEGGHEVIFGITTDPRFGPLLMFGLGGRYVEVFRDVRFGVLPLTPAEARGMVEGIRGAALLAGVRGEPPADVERLVEVLLRIAQLARRHPNVLELDVNPFLARPVGEPSSALDVRVRVGPPAAE